MFLSPRLASRGLGQALAGGLRRRRRLLDQPHLDLLRRRSLRPAVAQPVDHVAVGVLAALADGALPQPLRPVPLPSARSPHAPASVTPTRAARPPPAAAARTAAPP